jgi:cation diffusion facilitator CzcD-associated flavoprotein CzcO
VAVTVALKVNILNILKVPSHFYSYSFAPNPLWSRKFALQPEIHAYIASVARKYNIYPQIRFRTAVTRAVYDSETATWSVTVEEHNSGARYVRQCKILISAVGALSTPKRCDIPGATHFKGRIFHSAQWDHSFDYRGKEVVCIGS